MAVITQIPRTSLFWILGFMALLVIPHVLRLPVWVTALCVFCLLWRLGVHAGSLPYPGKLMRTVMVLAVVPVALVQYRGESGAIDVSVSLLLIGCCFKLLEMRYRRDVYIVIVLGFLLTLVSFIYSQSIPNALYNLLICWMLISCMISMNAQQSSQAENLKLAGLIIAQSLPLMLVLFVLVPRIAPLWAMPLPSGSTQTGITDEMTPGDITSLGRSGELAFRAKFNGPPPPNEELYWRGLVLDHFDGRTWSRARGTLFPRRNPDFPAAGSGENQAPVYEYDIILEPTQQPWLFGIKLAENLNPDVILDRNDTLISTRPINQRMRYELRSHPQLNLDGGLSRRQLSQSLQLPEGENPRTLALAAELRQSHPDDTDLIMAVLQRFREDPFYYTLTPSPLSDNSIDEFLFQTREGFCAHYAGSMVYLLRAAGIPARVVAGYQGGEFNRFDEYLMVYQYNAHAWTEVWLEGRGWVRFDPTAWVAPERIIEGAEQFFEEASGFLEESPFSMLRFRGTPWINTLRLRLDAMDYAWNRWVISYDSELQLQLLRQMFGAQAGRWSVTLLISLTACLLGFVAAWMWWCRRDRVEDAAERIYLRFCQQMASKGLSRRKGEGAHEYGKRMAAAHPGLQMELEAFTRLLQGQLYAGRGTRTDEGVTEQLRALSRQILRRLGAEQQKQVQTGRQGSAA